MSEQERAAMIERADAFVASKGNPRVEGDGNLLRFWLADFALEQIEADRRRIVAGIEAELLLDGTPDFGDAMWNSALAKAVEIVREVGDA